MVNFFKYVPSEMIVVDKKRNSGEPQNHKQKGKKNQRDCFNSWDLSLIKKKPISNVLGSLNRYMGRVTRDFNVCCVTIPITAVRDNSEN